MQDNGRFGVLALVLATGAYAFTPILVRLSEIGPVMTASWRLMIAVPIMWVLTRLIDPGSVDLGAPLRQKQMRLLVLTGALYGINLVFWQTGIVHTSIANASLLGNVHPIFVVAIAVLFQGERVRPGLIGGAVLALTGMAWLAGTKSGFADLAWGDVFVVTSSLFFSLWLICLNKLRTQLPAPTIVIWNLAISAIVTIPIGLLLGEEAAPGTLRGWLIIVGFSLVTNVIGQMALTFASGRVSPSVTSIGILVVPVLATVLGWFLLSEPLSAGQVLAGGCVLGGIIVAQHALRR